MKSVIPKKPTIVLKSSNMKKIYKGFEKPPIGKLLEQVLYLDSDMGIAYERAVGFTKNLHVHDRHIIIYPRGSCRMTVSLPAKNLTYKIDSTQVLWIPEEMEHDDIGISTIYDTLAMFPNQTYFKAMIEENGLNEKDQIKLEKEPILFKRTKWLDDIISRYFFERILNRKSPSGCTYFLEKQIINEIARIIFREKVNSWNKLEDTEKIGLEMALRFIESNLFEKLDLENISKVAKISESSLLRYFKKELDLTPYAYIKDRRLDEAMKLLKTGEYPVGDIAILVGYEDFSAFSKAFRQKFGNTPKSFLFSLK